MTAEGTGTIHAADPAEAAGAGTGAAVSSSTPMPRTLVAAVLGAGAVILLAAVLSITDPPASPDGYLPVLVAAGLLCLALLVHRRAPAIAWVTLITSGLVASGVPIALSRATDPGSLDLATWLVVAARSSGAAIVTTAIAALYATRPERQATRRVTTLATILVAWLTAACALVIILVIAGARADPALTWVDLAVRPTALVIHIVLVLTLFGVAGDIRAAAVRADARAELRDWPPGPATGGIPLDRRLRAILRELVPGAAEADTVALETERARLAGDLHAVVLPSLRRAIADVEAGGSADTLAARLRVIDLELERLMADRWPVVLDAFGLVAAVEELAERTEADDRLRVGLEIVADDGRPPRDVERAAWRIVQLALDNAVRHAAAEQVAVLLDLAPERVEVTIADDGLGLEPAAAGEVARAGGRGLVDLRRRAAAVGGRVEVGPNRPTGTRVRFTWPGSADRMST